MVLSQFLSAIPAWSSAWEGEPREEAPPPPEPPKSSACWRGRPWVNLLLLLATILCMTRIGAGHHQDFLSSLQETDGPFVLWHGFWYSLTILAILGVHELGHYCACRHHRVDASLPYFVPEPLLIGVLGAFIRIPEPIPSRRVLFDIGIAGPIAGFVVVVPALFVGIGLSRVVPLPDAVEGFTVCLREPLLFRFAARTIWGAVPTGYELSLHPMAFAAWIGLLATALNLLPIGQLDGGHISYAVFGRRSTLVTMVSVVVLFALAFHSPSWIAWAVALLVVVVVFGSRRPRTLIDHDVPADRRRVLVATCAVVIFIFCFTPAPLQFIGEWGGDRPGTGVSAPGSTRESPRSRRGESIGTPGFPTTGSVWRTAVCNIA